MNANVEYLDISRITIYALIGALVLFIINFLKHWKPNKNQILFEYEDLGWRKIKLSDDDELKIFYKDTELKSLYSLSIRVCNCSKISFYRKDLIRPISFSFIGSTQIIFSEIIRNKGCLGITKTDNSMAGAGINSVSFYFDKFPPGSEFCVELICAGRETFPIIDEKIAGTYSHKIIDPIESKLLREIDIFSWRLYLNIVIIAGIVCMYLGWLYNYMINKGISFKLIIKIIAIFYLIYMPSRAIYLSWHHFIGEYIRLKLFRVKTLSDSINDLISNKNKHKKLIKIFKKGLLFYNINPTAVDDEGNSILHILSEFYEGEHFLYYTIEFRERHMAAKNKKGQTPLHLAVAGGKLNNIMILCDFGADVNSKDNEGNTPLFSIFENDNDNNVKILLFLLSQGADINIKNNYGENILIRAILKSDKELIYAILEMGFIFDLKDPQIAALVKLFSVEPRKELLDFVLRCAELCDQSKRGLVLKF